MYCMARHDVQILPWKQSYLQLWGVEEFSIPVLKEQNMYYVGNMLRLVDDDTDIDTLS